LHPGGQPVDAHRLAGGGHLLKSLPKAARLVTKVPSRWQTPSAAISPNSNAMLLPTSVLETPTIRPARR
jgi:hypothetical protein